MSVLQKLLFLTIVGFAFCQENPGNPEPPRRTCRQSLMAGLRSIFEEDANDSCVSLSIFWRPFRISNFETFAFQPLKTQKLLAEPAGNLLLLD